MKENNIKHFKDDIRRTFIIYALIPVIIITFFSYSISFFILYRTVVKQNIKTNDEVSKRVDAIVSSYMEKANKLSRQENIIESLYTQNTSTKIYEELYNFVNSKDIKCNFFVFDENMKPIIESNSNLPSYAKSDNVLEIGITGRMSEAPNEVVIARVYSDTTERQTLTIGKAIMVSGKLKGYITFDLDNDDLARIISQNFSITVVIADKYDYVISGNNALMTNKFGKVDEGIKNNLGFTRSIEDSNYITKASILKGNIIVYTVTSVGYIGSIFLIVGMLLILLFLMLTLTTFLSARRIANVKTKVIDEIIEAMEEVQKGNLDCILNINTRDEFQIIAESYNQMLIEIKNLIELNKDRARESVLSEIQQLESQFNPHFLFNTLETIKYMCKMEPESVNKIIVGLSKVLRYSINNKISRVTLEEDIEYTKNYLLIQKYRFGNRFDYSIEVDENSCNCLVPKLIVQPIIENSIKYGYENNKHLNVKIETSCLGEKLEIIISDNGIGMEAIQLEEIRGIIRGSKNKSNHIGLYNVKRRVQLMYGDDYGIEIQSKKNKGTIVKIVLPICRSDGNHEHD